MASFTLKEIRERHGLSRTKLYQVWNSMRCRCTSKTYRDYRFYGGKGISVCDEWMASFSAFRNWAIANGYTDGLQLDRVDTHGNYSPDNCRFVTSKANNRNRSDNRVLTAFGETKTIPEWVEDKRCLVSARTLNLRVVRYGWEPEMAIVTQSQKSGTIR